MKRSVCAVVIIVGAVLLSQPGCGPTTDSGAEGSRADDTSSDTSTVYGHSLVKVGDEYDVRSLSDLESRSDVIVQVRALESKQYLAPDQEEYPIPDGVQQTQVLVERVLKPYGDLQEGTECTIVEYYVSVPSPNDQAVTVVQCVGNTMPMKMGEQYLLFLHDSSNDLGDYAIFALGYGKYRISKEVTDAMSVGTLSKEVLEAAEDQKGDPLYWQLAQEVVDKYMR